MQTYGTPIRDSTNNSKVVLKDKFLVCLPSDKINLSTIIGGSKIQNFKVI